MRVLEIDMGNTRSKWRLRDQDKILARGVEAIGSFPGAGFWSSVEGLGGVDVDAVHLAAVCSEPLVTAAVRSLREKIRAPLARAVPVSHSANGVACAYQDPASLGVDRWLAVLAAHGGRDPGGAGTMVVSCGTAVTLDFIRSDGTHEGGYIVPGFVMMREALLLGTGRIRFAALEFAPTQREPGIDTASAVQSGIAQALVSLVERSRSEAEARWGGKVELWLTGGDGQRLQAAIGSPCRYSEDLVLDGLSLALEAFPTGQAP